MSSSSNQPIYFGPFEVAEQVRFISMATSCQAGLTAALGGLSSAVHREQKSQHCWLISDTFQVFYKTEHSFALVNLKPLLPGHVLISPLRKVPRLTSLTPPEITDLMLTTQRVQLMLAKHYFPSPGTPESGSFNIAIQDGVAAGQSVAHVHVHIIPRTEGDGKGDGIYGELAGEEGNVGGFLWDKAVGERPVPQGRFPKIEDEKRMPRSKEVMKEEAEMFRKGIEELSRSEKA